MFFFFKFFLSFVALVKKSFEYKSPNCFFFVDLCLKFAKPLFVFQLYVQLFCYCCCCFLLVFQPHYHFVSLLLKIFSYRRICKLKFFLQFDFDWEVILFFTSNIFIFLYLSLAAVVKNLLNIDLLLILIVYLCLKFSKPSFVLQLLFEFFFFFLGLIFICF